MIGVQLEIGKKRQDEPDSVYDPLIIGTLIVPKPKQDRCKIPSIFLSPAVILNSPLVLYASSA